MEIKYIHRSGSADHTSHWLETENWEWKGIGGPGPKSYKNTNYNTMEIELFMWWVFEWKWVWGKNQGFSILCHPFYLVFISLILIYIVPRNVYRKYTLYMYICRNDLRLTTLWPNVSLLHTYYYYIRIGYTSWENSQAYLGWNGSFGFWKGKVKVHIEG
jgi:hypothetical protein